MDFVIKKTESTNRTIRMPIHLMNKIDELASKNSISFNQLVIQCCEFALEHIKDENLENDNKTSG